MNSRFVHQYEKGIHGNGVKINFIGEQVIAPNFPHVGWKFHLGNSRHWIHSRILNDIRNKHMHTFLYALIIRKFDFRTNKTTNKSKINTNGVHQNILKIVVSLCFKNCQYYESLFTAKESRKILNIKITSTIMKECVHLPFSNSSDFGYRS